MQQRIDGFSQLSDLLKMVANENALAAKSACQTISKSNGTLRKAICPIFQKGNAKK